jgi:hypothetical protein
MRPFSFSSPKPTKIQGYLDPFPPFALVAVNYLDPFSPFKQKKKASGLLRQVELTTLGQTPGITTP